jgi:hypothetical protein
VHINGAERDELLAVQLAEVTVDELDQATQLADLWGAAAAAAKWSQRRSCFRPWTSDKAASSLQIGALGKLSTASGG